MKENKIKSINEQIAASIGDGQWSMAVMESGNFFVCNYTVGLEKAYNHPELQIFAPLDSSIAHYIFQHFVEMLDNNQTIKLGQTYDGILNEQAIKVVEYHQYGEIYYRLWISDKQGYFPNHKKCNPSFKTQIFNIELL